MPSERQASLNHAFLHPVWITSGQAYLPYPFIYPYPLYGMKTNISSSCLDLFIQGLIFAVLATFRDYTTEDETVLKSIYLIHINK